MKLSPDEKLIMKILGRRKMKIGDIADIFYNSNERTVESNNYIAGAIRRINRKCMSDENIHWYIAGQGRGRYGRTVWREKL